MAHVSARFYGNKVTIPKKENERDMKIAIPKGNVVVVVGLREPYPSILMELYPDLSLGLAVKQFIIDNIKTEEL